LSGYTDNYIRVIAREEEALVNTIRPVALNEIKVINGDLFTRASFG
jgi:hypothetical protein